MSAGGPFVESDPVRQGVARPRNRRLRCAAAVLLLVAGAAFLVLGVIAPGAPAISAVSSPRIDFGVVELGADPVALRHVLRYRNTGWRSIELLGTAATCGCTAVTSDVKAIEAGGELDIDVVMTIADAIHRDSAVRVAFGNGQLFVHEFHALGARSVGVKLLAGPTEEAGHGLRLWLLATTASDTPPPPPTCRSGGSILALDEWIALGGGSGRKPHHWMTWVDMEFEDAPARRSSAQPPRRQPPLLIEVGPQPLRIERPVGQRSRSRIGRRGGASPVPSSGSSGTIMISRAGS